MSQRVKNLFQNKTEINQTNDINTLINSNENQDNTINTSINLTNENLNLPMNNLPYNHNLNFGFYSPFNSFYPPFLNNNVNSFFDKLFMTFERTNYQMYHLCEVINMIENQKQTLKYVYFLLKQIYKTILQKYYSILENLKQYLFSLKDIFTKNNSLFTINELNNHIQILNFLIKVIISLCIIKLFIY
jgi:hypothetical protein